MPFDTSIPGWMTPAELKIIEMIARNKNPDRVLEIGSLAGRSAICWAETLPYTKVFCVDPWAAQRIGDEPWLQSNNTWTHFSDKELNQSLYGVFLNNTQDYKNIRGIRTHSWEFMEIAQTCDWLFDIIFIDGDHSEDGFRNDLIVASTLLTDGGFVLIHDYDNEAFPHIKPLFDEWNYAGNRVLKFWDGTMLALSMPKAE